MNRRLVIVLTYAPGTYLDPAHMRDFVLTWRQWCTENGFNASYLWWSVLSNTGRQWFEFTAVVPRGIRVPRPDQQGMDSLALPGHIPSRACPVTGPRSFSEVLDSLIASGSTALKRCYQCDKLTGGSRLIPDAVTAPGSFPRICSDLPPLP